MAVFSYSNGTTVVSEAGVSGTVLGSAFRIYSEVSGDVDHAASGSIQTGFAIANGNAAINATVTLDLMNLAATVLRTATVTIPANGQAAMFLSQIAEFKDMPLPFNGVLRLRSSVTGGIAVTGLRGRYNERGEFLFASTPPIAEGVPTNGEVVFPHIADGGGYTTQFILMSSAASQAAAGSLNFYDATGTQTTMTLASAVLPKPSVNVVSAGNLISMPGHFFDLEGKTIRFLPSGTTYSSQVLPLAFDESGGTTLSNSQGSVGGQDPTVRSWPVRQHYVWRRRSRIHDIESRPLAGRHRPFQRSGDRQSRRQRPREDDRRALEHVRLSDQYSFHSERFGRNHDHVASGSQQSFCSPTGNLHFSSETEEHGRD